MQHVARWSFRCSRAVHEKILRLRLPTEYCVEGREEEERSGYEGDGHDWDLVYLANVMSPHNAL